VDVSEVGLETAVGRGAEGGVACGIIGTRQRVLVGDTSDSNDVLGPRLGTHGVLPVLLMDCVMSTSVRKRASSVSAEIVVYWVTCALPTLLVTKTLR
jgi:hypothetical protein